MWIVSDSRPASDRQMAYAEAIARKLRIELPPVVTRRSISLFIQEHVERYRDTIDEERELRMVRYQAVAQFCGNREF